MDCAPSSSFGLTVPSCLQYYELRWPRITKVNRLDGGPLDLSELQKKAVKAMRVVSADSSHYFMQRTLSKGFPAVAPPETEEERYARELRYWVGTLEKADKVGAEHSMLRELSTDVQPPPLRALASVTNLRAEGKGKARASPPPVEEEPSRSSLRFEDTVVHFDIDLTSSPTPSSVRQPLASLSSPSRPTQLPAPAVSSPPTSPSAVITLSSSTSQQLGKRSLASCPSIPPSPLPTALSTSADAPSSRKRIRRRYTLPSFSSPSTLTVFASRASSSSNPPSPTPPNPYDDFAWSLGVFPTLGSSVPTPEQPFLDSGNYVLNPLDVLWCAGWLPTDRSVAYEGLRRTGYIFVEGGQADVEILKEKRGSMVQDKGPAMTVWIVEKSALETLGDWDKEGLLSVF